MLKASSRQLNGIVVVDLSGRITLDEGSAVLRETVRNLLGEGKKNILLNLADVTDLDSSGIGVLVGTYTDVRDQGGKLKLLNLSERVNDRFQITKLDTVFDVQDDEAAAVAAFGT